MNTKDTFNIANLSAGPFTEVHSTKPEDSIKRIGFLHIKVSGHLFSDQESYIIIAGRSIPL